MKEVFPGVYNINQKIATLNSVPGTKPFNEILVTVDEKEYRLWDPNRSKASAAILKGLKEFPIKKGSIILYLGIAHGFTASYFSDIIGPNGVIYGIEFSDRCFNELLNIAARRRNILPILADARKTEEFKDKIIEKVDIVYVDIAQPDATEVAIRNCKKFLKPHGYLMFTVKTQSVDVTQPAKITVKFEMEKIAQADFEIIDWKMLDPFEECHGFILARMKA